MNNCNIYENMLTTEKPAPWR